MRLGADEAGKGPVLGSMFAAAVRADPITLPDDIADSKTLTPERRTELDEAIRRCADAVSVAEIPVTRIDDPATDMNTLTVEAQARALADVARDGLTATVDAADTDANRFGRRVADQLPPDVDVRAFHGADATDPLVGAASIVAKVARDTHVAALTDRYGDLGSGYPSDPQTRAFLRDYVSATGDLPPCARTSWQTSADVLRAATESSLAEF